MAKPNCYQCRYRAGIPGDAHSECQHPATIKIRKSPLKLIALLQGRIPPLSVDGITVRGATHGIRMGWFNWPFNFDPIWLVECSGFSQKGNPNETDRG